MEYWIRIENDKVVDGHHPAFKQNIIDAFPELGGNITEHFAPVDLTPAPSLNYGEVMEGPFYKWNDSHDKIINYYIVKQATE